MPAISDPEIESAFKDLLAASWNELPGSLVREAEKAVSKATDDKAGQEALKNVFRAAEACEEFSGTLVTLRMALDDLCGLTGEVSICYLKFSASCALFFFFPFCAYISLTKLAFCRMWVPCLVISKMLLKLHIIAT